MCKSDNQLVRLEGRAAPKNEIVVYQPNDITRLEVRVDSETVWLTQAQMCQLFQRDVSVISRHIRNIFTEGELDRESNLHFLQIANSDRPITLYSLNVIISVGYRIKSVVGTRFRIWATGVLRELLLRGIALPGATSALAAEMDRRFANHEQRIASVEERIDFVIRSALPAPEMVFCEGAFLTAHDAIRKIVKAAKRRLILVDNFIDERVLTLLAERRAGVTCRVYGKNAAKRDIQLAFSRFQQQYPNDGLTLTQYASSHDRFIICDNTVWLCGASVKDAGRRMFALVKTSLPPDLILNALPSA